MERPDLGWRALAWVIHKLGWRFILGQAACIVIALGTGSGVLFALCELVLFGWLALRGMGRRGGSLLAGSAWSTFRWWQHRNALNLEDHILKEGAPAGPTVRRFILGEGGGALVGAWATGPHGRGSWPIVSNSRGCVGVIGGPGAGKSRTVVKPAVANHPGPVVAASTKPEILLDTLAVRLTVGRVFVLDLAGTLDQMPTGVTELRWSPVQGCEDFEAALLRAKQMTGAVASGKEDATAKHFTDLSASLLAVLLHAGALGGRHITDVHRWILEADTQLAYDLLPENSMAVSLLRGIERIPSRERGGVFSTASRALAAFQHASAVRAATAPETGAVAAWLDAATFVASEADTIFIVAPSSVQELLAPVVVGVLTEIRQCTFSLSAEIVKSGKGERRLPPVLFALDECANIAPLPDLPSTLSEAGGQGLQVLAVFQDTAQMQRRWGAEADGMLSLFASMVVLPGIKNGQTLELLSQIAGEFDRQVTSVSDGSTAGHTAGFEGSGSSSRTNTRTVSTSIQRQRVAPVEAIAQMPPGRGMLWRGDEWMWVQLSAWDTHPVWKAVANQARHRLSGATEITDEARHPNDLIADIPLSRRQRRQFEKLLSAATPEPGDDWVDPATEAELAAWAAEQRGEAEGV